MVEAGQAGLLGYGLETIELFADAFEVLTVASAEIFAAGQLGNIPQGRLIQLQGACARKIAGYCC